MKYRFGDVKVLDAKGNIKKVIKATTISKKSWKKLNSTTVYGYPKYKYKNLSEKEEYTPRYGR